MSYSSISSASIRKYTDMDKKELKPGDLIEIFRGLYKHWAVYVGGGNVVHFTVPDSGLTSSSEDKWQKGAVLKEKLVDVVGDDKWRINNLLDHKYKPRPANDIVKQACSLVDTELDYNLLKYNCEHFATEMRYGKCESRQVQKAAAVATAGGGAAALALVGASVSASVSASARKM